MKCHFYIIEKFCDLLSLRPSYEHILPFFFNRPDKYCYIICLFRFRRESQEVWEQIKIDENDEEKQQDPDRVEINIKVYIIHLIIH